MDFSHTDLPPSARHAAALAAIAAVKEYPHLEASTVDTAGLDPRDARLAMAIDRAVMQRWLTAEFLLDKFLNKPMRTLQAELRGILLSAAVQLLFFDRLPAYAIVDESVGLTRKLVRKNAGGLANAVLRKLADVIDRRDSTAVWSPAPNCVPLEEGVLYFKQPLLPDPATEMEKHLSIATSHPSVLVQRWVEQYGLETARRLCLHGIVTPPLIVACEGDAPPAAPLPNQGADAVPAWKAHQSPGFIVWDGSHEALLRFLQGHPARRVQDPASAQPVGLTQELSPRVILDYCAGRGTKTRQLAARFPQARIIAGDVNAARLASLRETAALYPNVVVVDPAQFPAKLGSAKADLILLDVPCSNTAVLARRPEARYRYRPASMDKLVALQEDIIRQALKLAAPGAYVLYATCSLDERENQKQAQFMASQFQAEVVKQAFDQPAGRGVAHHDGYYAVLLKLPA